MLLVSGAVALSRKLQDEKTKRREARQGNLEIGDSNVAKRAFASQTSVNRSEPAIVKRAPTEIKYEDPIDVTAASADSASPAITSPIPKFGDARHSARLNVTSPVQSERGLQEPRSPYSEGNNTSSDQQSLHPPPYSAQATPESSLLRPSLSSHDTDVGSMVSMETSSGTVRSTNSNGTRALRIKTIGSELKSGFPYHEALFEMNVHPQKWTDFTAQVIEGAKLSASDQAATWASATAVAMTGAIGTSVMLGRSMTRMAQEKKIKAGLASSDSRLGETLKMWNDEYFSPRGLFAHLELSESAMKNPGQQSKALRKSTLMYSNPEDRQRKREERKFVIVVTKLDDEGAPMEALRELEIEEKRNEARDPEKTAGVVEIGSSDIPIGAVELPSDQTTMPAELPAEASTSPKAYEAPGGYVEMSSDNTVLLEKMHIHDGQGGYQHNDYYNTGYPQAQEPRAYDFMSPQEEKMHLEAARQGSYQNQDSTVTDPPSKATERYLPLQGQMPPQQDNSFSVVHAHSTPIQTSSAQPENTPSSSYVSPHTTSPDEVSTEGHVRPLQSASEQYGLTSAPLPKFETTSVNPYTLQPDKASELRDYEVKGVQGTPEDVVPKPLDVKTTKGVALYDGADWGEDYNYA